MESKTRMPYTNEMKEELEKEMLLLEGVSKLNWNKAKSTESSYLKFTKDEIPFKVRISSHTKSTYRNEVLFYNSWDECWMIDANLGCYKPNDVIQIAKNVCDNLSKYNNTETKEKIKRFAHNNDIEPEDEDDVFNLSSEIAEKYINEKGLREDKYGSTYQVLQYISILSFGGYWGGIKTTDLVIYLTKNS